MKNFLFILLLLFSFSSYAKNDFIGKKILCSKLLWGFEFISSNKVRVINTDINQQTKIKDYNYEVDLNLSYLNIFLIEDSIKNNVYSIDLNTLRVDIWTMTSGGNTTREMIPNDFCEIVKIENILNHINNLKTI